MESLSRPPHRRKHSNATTASSSSAFFSLKNPYDDVLFSNGGKSKFGAHEYVEVFSGSSSIPVLDLSGLEKRVGSGELRRSKPDYSSIFGGLGDDEVAAPYEELLNGAHKKTKTRIPADAQSTHQESGSPHSSGKTEKSSSASPDQSTGEQISVSFNKSSQRNNNPSTRFAELHAVPGFTYFVDRTAKTDGGERHLSSSMKREVSRTSSFSAGIEEVRVNGGLLSRKNPHFVPDRSSNLNEIKTGGEHLASLFDEEVDENSIAAVSAAALKKAIEQAQESIRIAKMIMDRGKEGSLLVGSISRSKGRLRMDKRKARVDPEAEMVRENVGAAKEHVDALSEESKKFFPSYSQRETICIAENFDLENVKADAECESCLGQRELNTYQFKGPEASAELAERAPKFPIYEALKQCRSTVGQTEPERVEIFSPVTRKVGENSRTSEESTEERASVADDRGKREKKFVELESESNNNLLNKSGNLVAKYMLDQECMEKNSVNASVSKENCVHGKGSDEEINKMEPDEAFPEIGKKVNEAHELETGEKKLNSGDGQKLHVQNEIVEETNDTREENQDESVSEKDNDEAVEARSNDSGVSDTHSNDSTIFSETQENYDVDLNSKAEEYQENDSLSGAFPDEEVNDSLHRCASEENFIVNNDLENAGLMNVVTSKTSEFDHTNSMEGKLENKKCAKNAKDNIDATCDEREYVKEQNEPKETDKSIGSEKNKDSFVEQKDPKGNERKLEMDNQQQRIEAIKRGREREKDRIAVERAIREARERAFAEARERAEQERAREKATDKASIEAAKLRAERAAVERATAEARERALEKARTQKANTETRTQAKKYPTEEFSSSSRCSGLKHSFSSSDLEKIDGTTSESAQRCKARLERHQRIMERAAKALAEKNMRDFLSQKEQAERNRLAESLDADIKRWVTGKENNLRALLSTLQYILEPDSGWQPISLTEIITTAAVKKAYRKATLCVHPDKLQQRRASIQQKYICEKVFDLLKAAWNRFNSEER
ncbi:auxilin-like protein 1 [Phtheirospermum japonicum]|uniref:Auxilin-like protein 1 n=1 Tax=Phtheirospermum japonicum TaxID=374723 RepID=A0A830BXK2_9LAMI|nr:auxilin-like protein 1 [Phtheirospermum japonicum]